MGSLLRALEIVSILLPCAALVSTCAMILTGCADRAESPALRAEARSEESTSTTRSAPSYEAIPVVNGGTITGSVVWVGERPDALEIDVPIHREHCGEKQRSPVLQIGRRGGIAHTVVWLEGIRRGRALQIPSEPVVVSLSDCAFAPHAVAVPVGANIEFRNAEPILHNVHAFRIGRNGAERSWFSEGLPEPGASFATQVEIPGLTRLLDDAGHPWMLGWMHAFEHPYYAVSDDQGRFQLVGIPTGQYVLRAWHEGVLTNGETRAGRPVYSAPIVLSRPVTVSSGHDTTIDFTMSLAAAEAAGG